MESVEEEAAVRVWIGERLGWLLIDSWAVYGGLGAAAREKGIKHTIGGCCGAATSTDVVRV